MLVTTVINVDAYPSLPLSDPSCHLEDTVIAASNALCLLIARRLNMEVSTMSR